jgi:hypothetical protein
MKASRAIPDDRTTRLVLVAYLVLTAAPFLIAATHHTFWERAHSMAPAATVVVAGPLLALVRRHRRAWIVLTVFQGGVLLSFAFDFGSVAAFALNLIAFALLVSSPMRRHVFDRATPAARARSYRPDTAPH